MDNNQKPQQQGLQIDLSPEVSKGIYSNFAIISHSKNEFVADFAMLLPGMPKAQVGSRVILAPEHAKRLATRRSLAKLNCRSRVVLAPSPRSVRRRARLKPG